MKKLYFITIFIISIAPAALAQEQSPVSVVQKQLDTYNAHDIDGFAAVFSEEAEIFMNIGDKEPAMKGKAEIKKRYGKMFVDSPQNKSTLVGRLVQGNFVFDHERITGRDNPFKIVAIYEVKDGLIVRAWFVR